MKAVQLARGVVLVVALAWLGGPTSDATACSCASSEDGFLVPARVTLPSNALGIAWSGWLGPEAGTTAETDVARFSIERRGVGRWQSLEPELVALPDSMLGGQRGPRTGLVRPRGGFEPGWLYRVRSARPVQEILVDVSAGKFSVAEKTVRILIGSQTLGPVQCATRSGMCATRFLGASSQVELDLPGDLRRFADALLYIVRLEDGEIWRPDSSLCDPTPMGWTSVGRGRELLFCYCDQWPVKRKARPGEFAFLPEPTSNLPPGTHALTFTAWLPGTRESITGHARVTLSCSGGRGKP